MMIINQAESKVRELEARQKIESLEKEIQKLRDLCDDGIKECYAENCQLVAFDIPVAHGEAEYRDLVKMGWYVFVVHDRDDCGLTTDYYYYCPDHHKEAEERRKKLDGDRVDSESWS